MSTAASGHAARHTADCGYSTANQSACTTGSKPQNGLSRSNANYATCNTSSNGCDVFDQLLNGDPSAKGIANV